MSFSTINTEGGPERNGRCETIGVDGQPIPHLYNAGELGSFNGLAYTVGNILEALDHRPHRRDERAGERALGVGR